MGCLKCVFTETGQRGLRTTCIREPTRGRVRIFTFTLTMVRERTNFDEGPRLERGKKVYIKKDRE